jgi:hypothetical protein
MMQCNKTGLTDNNWKTILDVLNVYDPNDIMHVYPEMGDPEFVQDVTLAFHKVREHVSRINEREGITLEHSTSDVKITTEPYVTEVSSGAIL